MKMRSNTVAATSAGRAATPTSPEAAAWPSYRPQRPQAQAAPDNPRSQLISATRKWVWCAIALAGVLVLVAGALAAKRINLSRPQVVASYNSRLADLDAKLSRALAGQLRAAGYEFDAAIVSVEGPACQRAVCLVKGFRREDFMTTPVRLAASHAGNGSWSVVGMGALAELKFNVDAATEMRRLAESTPPEFPQVPVSAAPIQSKRETRSLFHREFELWLSAQTDGRRGQWLDLESGQCLTEPDWDYGVHLFSYSYPLWFRRNHLDVSVAVYSDGCCWLLTRQLAVAPVDTKLWDQATPDKLSSHPALPSAPRLPHGAVSPVRDQTDTYLFRTEEGSIGILRVLELNRASEKVKIQYKLATRATKSDT